MLHIDSLYICLYIVIGNNHMIKFTLSSLEACQSYHCKTIRRNTIEFAVSTTQVLLASICYSILFLRLASCGFKSVCNSSKLSCLLAFTYLYTHVMHMHSNIIHIVSPCVGRIKEATLTLRKQDPALRTKL